MEILQHQLQNKNLLRPLHNTIEKKLSKFQ